MKIWTIEEEASKLSKRFEGVNRAAFARENKVPGGQAGVYQHITGRRPISREAAQAYARGFHCKLEEISPRLALEAQKTLALGGGGDGDGTAHSSQISEPPNHTEDWSGKAFTREQQQMLSLIESIDPEDRKAWLKVGTSLAKANKSVVTDVPTDNSIDSVVGNEIKSIEPEQPKRFRDERRQRENPVTHERRKIPWEYKRNK